MLGIVVNRFRGDASLFEDGIRILEAKSGLPVLALVANVEHGLDEEDRPFRIPVDHRAPPGQLKVGAVLYPRVSNTEDLAPLLAEPDLHMTWVTDPALAREMDLLVLPGSKATVGDLVQLTASGMAEALREAAARGAWLLGLCGGYQMLGRELRDDAGSEGGARTFPGLGLLPLATSFEDLKITRLAEAGSLWPEPGPPPFGLRDPPRPHGPVGGRGRTPGRGRPGGGLADGAGGGILPARAAGLGPVAGVLPEPRPAGPRPARATGEDSRSPGRAPGPVGGPSPGQPAARGLGPHPGGRPPLKAQGARPRWPNCPIWL